MSSWKSNGDLKQFYVYIMSNHSMTLYTGVTNSVMRRAGEHQTGKANFTSTYHCNRLVYFECYDNARDAIQREKQIKGWTRARKIALVKTLNPEWHDLSQPFSQEP